MRCFVYGAVLQSAEEAGCGEPLAELEGDGEVEIAGFEAVGLRGGGVGRCVGEDVCWVEDDGFGG